MPGKEDFLTFKERIRTQFPLIDVAREDREVGEARGGSARAICMWHDDHNPSLDINTQTERFKCWSCGASGDVFDWIGKREGLEFKGSIEFLAERAGLEVPWGQGRSLGAKALYEALAKAEEFFHRTLLGDGCAEQRAYLEGRGIPTAMWKRFRIGYAPGKGRLIRFLKGQGIPDQAITGAGLSKEKTGRPVKDDLWERLVFPIRNEMGRTVAFGGRRLDGEEPKYLNTRETAVYHKERVCYGLDLARNDFKVGGDNEILLVEGYLDVVALAMAGENRGAAICGTSFTTAHASLLGRFVNRVVFIPDGDSGGRVASRKALRNVAGTRLEAQHVRLTDGQDPLDVVVNQGTEALVALLSRRRPLLDAVLDDITHEHDPDSGPGVENCVADFWGLFGDQAAAPGLEVWERRAAEAFGITVEALRSRRPGTRAVRPEPQTEHGVITPAPPQLQAADRIGRDLLVGLVLDAGRLPAVQQVIVEGDFAHPAHEALWQAFCIAYGKGGSLDLDQWREDPPGGREEFEWIRSEVNDERSSVEDPDEIGMRARVLVEGGLKYLDNMRTRARNSQRWRKDLESGKKQKDDARRDPAERRAKDFGDDD